MRTVNISDLEHQLSGYLRYVKNGEELVIREEGVSVARILPFRSSASSERDRSWSPRER